MVRIYDYADLPLIISDFDDSDLPPEAPEEGDLMTNDCVSFYEDGRLAFTVEDDEDTGDAIRAWMAEEGFYPNVWLLDDHGDCELLNY